MSGEPDSTWMDAVRDKVIECFGDSDPETTVRILGYLNEEESAHGDPARSQTLKTLRAALKSDGTFRLYVQRLDEDIRRRVEGDQQAAEPIAASSSQPLTLSVAEVPESYALELEPGADLGEMDDLPATIVECFLDSGPETLNLLLSHVDIGTHEHDPAHGRAWKSLRATLRSNVAFRQNPGGVRSDKEEEDRDQQCAQLMTRLYSTGLSDAEVAEICARRFARDADPRETDNWARGFEPDEDLSERDHWAREFEPDTDLSERDHWAQEFEPDVDLSERDHWARGFEPGADLNETDVWTRGFEPDADLGEMDDLPATLVKYFLESGPETLNRLLSYLDQEKPVDVDDPVSSRAWISLRASLKSSIALGQNPDSARSGPRGEVRDQQVAELMNGLYELELSDREVAEICAQRFEPDADLSEVDDLPARLVEFFVECDPETLAQFLLYWDEGYVDDPVRTLAWKSLRDNLWSNITFRRQHSRDVRDDRREEVRGPWTFQHSEEVRGPWTFQHREEAEGCAQEQYQAGAESPPPSGVREKLVQYYAKSDPETLTRILFYLDDEERTCGADNGPSWRSLQACLDSEAAFRGYAETLRDDTKTAEKDPKYAKFMSEIQSQWLVPSETQVAEGSAQGFQPKRMANDCQTVALMGFTKAWSVIPKESQVVVRNFVAKFMPGALVRTVDDAVGLVNEVGGTVAMVGLAGVHMAREAYKNLKRWWKGEISGVRCCKNVVDSFVGIAAGMAGGVGGTALGGLVAGPIGAVVGGVLGSVLSAPIASLLSDRLTQALFGVPKSEALENAYRFLGVKMTASNGEINRRFHQLCLQYHPDKGGSSEKFHELQVHMGLIRIERDLC